MFRRREVRIRGRGSGQLEGCCDSVDCMTGTGKLAEDAATVQRVGDYALVTFGGWQVTVMPDHTISLPRLVRPEDVDDFCGAMAAAKEVALEQRESVRVEGDDDAVSAVQDQSDRQNSGRVRQSAQQAKSARSARAKRSRGARKQELEQAPGKES